MWHKPCRTFHPWCLCIKTRCLYNVWVTWPWGIWVNKSHVSDEELMIKPQNKKATKPICIFWWGVLYNQNRKIYNLHTQCYKLGKIFTCSTYKLLLCFTVIPDVYKSFFPNKTTYTKYCLTQWISKLSVRGKFLGSGGHSKRNYLQDRANFHRHRHNKLP